MKTLRNFVLKLIFSKKFFEFFLEHFSHCFSREILVIFPTEWKAIQRLNNKDFFSFGNYSCPASRIARGIEFKKKKINQATDQRYIVLEKT